MADEKLVLGHVPVIIDTPEFNPAKLFKLAVKLLKSKIKL